MNTTSTDVPTGRTPHHRLAGATVLLLVLAALLAVPPSARAIPPGISLAAIAPVDAGDLLVARTAADNPLHAPTWMFKGDIWLNNSGTQSRDVTSVTFSYPGSSQSSFTYTPMSFPSDAPPALFTMPAGMQGRVPVYDGLQRDLPFPLPATMRIELFFDSDPVPLQLDFGLRVRDNDVPTGSYLFPAKASDLEPGQYWAYGTRHVVDAGGGGGTLNPSTRAQRHGLDMDVVQWNEDVGQWRNTKPGTDGSANSDYWGFGEPLYALADGEIISCYRGEVDHAPGGFDDIDFDNNTGNSLVIVHGGDRATYAHMKFGSIPAALCPSSGQNDGLSIPVAAGQYLGDMGNTGRSTNAHLHLHVEHADDSDPVQGVPIQFNNIRARGHASSINGLGSSPALQPLHGLTLHRHSLVLPNPCGTAHLPGPGGIEVSHHGIAIDCWQDVFNQVTSRGYRLVWADMFEVDGQTYVNATFRPSGPASVVRHGLTGTQYQDLFDDLTADGFRLHQVDSYLDGGQVRYAAIFEQRPGPAYAAFHGLDEPAYEDRLDELAAAGLVPVNVSTVEVGGQLYYTGLFEQVQVTGWTIHTVPVGNYQATFDANVAAGRIPIYVEGVSTSGAPFLTGIWVDPIGGSTAAVHGLDSDDYQDAFESNLVGGRLTRAVTGYDDGAGNARYAAVWRSRPDTSISSTPDAVTNQSTATFTFAGDNPFTRTECAHGTSGFTSCTSPRTLVGLAEGWHTFAVRAVDREGVRDLSPASYTWLVDLTPPEVDITTPADDTKTVNGELKDDPVDDTTVVGWAEVVVEATDVLSGVATVVFDVDGTPVAAADVDHVAGSDTWAFQFEPDQNGETTYVITATVTDVAGNMASDSIEVVGVRTGKPTP